MNYYGSTAFRENTNRCMGSTVFRDTNQGAGKYSGKLPFKAVLHILFRPVVNIIMLKFSLFNGYWSYKS
jgi:hypothetical protein